MSTLDVLKRIAANVAVLRIREGMGCPECRYWASTRDGKNECVHPDEWEPSAGGLLCANKLPRTTTATRL